MQRCLEGIFSSETTYLFLLQEKAQLQVSKLEEVVEDYKKKVSHMVSAKELSNVQEMRRKENAMMVRTKSKRPKLCAYYYQVLWTLLHFVNRWVSHTNALTQAFHHFRAVINGYTLFSFLMFILLGPRPWPSEGFFPGEALVDFS